MIYQSTSPIPNSLSSFSSHMPKQQKENKTASFTRGMFTHLYMLDLRGHEPVNFKSNHAAKNRVIFAGTKNHRSPFLN